MFNPSVAPELKRSAEARARGGRKSPRRSSASGRTKSSGLPGTPNHEPKRSDKRNYSYAPPPGKRQTGFCRRRFEKILPSFQFYIITKRPLAAATASILHKTPRMICCFFFSSNARFKRKWQSLFGADCRLNPYVAYCKKNPFRRAHRQLSAYPLSSLGNRLIVELNPQRVHRSLSGGPFVAVYLSERVIILANKWKCARSPSVSFSPSVSVCFTRSAAVAFFRPAHHAL